MKGESISEMLFTEDMFDDKKDKKATSTLLADENNHT